MLRALRVSMRSSAHQSLTPVLQRRQDYQLHFTDEKTKVKLVKRAELGFETRDLQFETASP